MSVRTTSAMVAVVAVFGMEDAAASVTLSSGPVATCFTGGASFPGPPYNSPDALSPAPGDLTSSSCYALTVVDGSFSYLDPTNNAAVAPRRLTVRQSNVASPVGTVIFTTGVFGQSLYSRGGRNRLDTVTAMRAAGYQTFELQWEGPHGFATGGEGAGWAELAGAYVEVVQYLLDQQVAEPTAPLCATGNSGGASQIAYGLSAHGGEGLFTAVVMSGGPPIVDHVDACFLTSFHVVDFPTSGGMGPTHPGREVVDATLGWIGQDYCVNATSPPAPDLSRARRDSLLSSGPDADTARDLQWSGVTADFVWAEGDITGATVHAQAFEAALARAQTVTHRAWVTTGAAAFAHNIDDTAVGAAQIQALLQAHCR